MSSLMLSTRARSILGRAGIGGSACPVTTTACQARTGALSAICFSSGDNGREDMGKQPVRVSFRLPYRCEFGQNLSIAGSISPLGAWNERQCLDMQWTDGDVWQAEVEIPALSILGECEYKYVVRNTDGSIAMWTPGDNFELRLSPEEARGAAVPEKVEISDAWDASWRKVRIRVREVLADQQSFSDGGSVNQYASPSELEGNYNVSAVSQVQTVHSGKLAVRTAEVENKRALEQLRATVESATVLLGSVDATSPEALEADLRVSQAALRAQATSAALQEAKRREELGEGR